MKPTVVSVEWLDSRADLSSIWKRVDKVKFDETRIETIGFLICETATFVCIASSFDRAYYAGEMKIPKSCIVKRRVIRKRQ